jgi:microcystin-dependent protein
MQQAPYIVKTTDDVNTVTISRTDTTINGDANYVISSQWEGVQIAFDETNFYTLGNYATLATTITTAATTETAGKIEIATTAEVVAATETAKAVTPSNIRYAVPAGAVLPFAQNSAPDGWLKCNGAAVSRTTYATLFAAIGETYGAGDGSTTFLLPDLRGEFVRGWDDARGVDAGRAIGSTQADDFKAHNHDIPVGYGGSYTNDRLRRHEATSNTGTFTAMANTGGTDTRPRNVALLYCIKF